VLLVLALLAALGLVAFLLAPSSKRRVPSVIGFRDFVATTILKRDGFKVLERFSPSRAVIRGRVLATSPRAKTDASEGSTVTLFVSSGAPTAEVPNVVGAGRMAATRQLRQLGFKILTRNTPDNTVPSNHVISTSPPPFALVRVGSTVTLTVSSGRSNVPVPTVLGKQLADARATLEGQGFRVVTVKRVSDQPPGTVLDQSPSANTPVAPGSTVTLTVARQSNRVAVPNVISETENRAVDDLARAGLGATVVTQTVTNNSQDGVVLQQSPPAGHKLKKGSTVTLTVGHFAGPATGPTGPGK
jgi:serine/threonine-protein kinase